MADIYQIIPAIRSLLTLSGEGPIIRFIPIEETGKSIPNEHSFQQELNGLSGLYIPKEKDTKSIVDRFRDLMNQSGFETGLVWLEKTGMLGIGRSRDEAEHFINQFRRGTTMSFPEEESKTARLKNRTCIVTGGAQGFGKGIVREMVFEGTYVVIADINEEIGKKSVEEINREIGRNHVSFIRTDVTNPDSVRDMVRFTVREFGGLDMLISNAGVLQAGSLEEMDEKTFDFVTDVNYKGFFLCTKYGAEVMKVQHAHNPDLFMDIIQINSKSGLAGSNKNFAYAGSKFGAIGLTQSFALELVPFRIKVNAICPGNYFEGPLWADPDNGLFAQYLRAGKVPGAKTIEDVRMFYESKVPMGRGCTPSDVVKAIYYIAEQHYETGQAIPVTGGQMMLN